MPSGRGRRGSFTGVGCWDTLAPWTSGSWTRRGLTPITALRCRRCSSAATASSGSISSTGTTTRTGSSPGSAATRWCSRPAAQRNHVPTVHSCTPTTCFVTAHVAPARRDRARAPARARPGHRATGFLVTVHGPINPVVDPDEALVETDGGARAGSRPAGSTPATPAELSYAITSARRAARQRALISQVAEKLPGPGAACDAAPSCTDPEALLERMFLIRHELITARTMAAQCTRRVGPDRRARQARPRAGTPGLARATSPTSSTGCARSPTASRSSCSA